MRRAFLAVFAVTGAVLAVGAAGAAAQPTDFTCNTGGSQIGGTFHNVTVGPLGCELINVTVTGDVQSNGAAFFELEGSVVNGNVQVNNTKGVQATEASKTNDICNSHIGNDLQIQNSAAASSWIIGNGADNGVSDCQFNSSLNGPGNSSGGNIIGGNLQFSHNAGASNTIQHNNVKNDLQANDHNTNTTCTANTVGGNTQC